MVIEISDSSSKIANQYELKILMFKIQISKNGVQCNLDLVTLYLVTTCDLVTNLQ